MVEHFFAAYAKSPKFEGRSFGQRVYDGLLSAMIGDRPVIANVSVKVNQPILKRGLIMCNNIADQ